MIHYRYFGMVDRVSMAIYNENMHIADKILYYSGLAAIALGLALIILGVSGVMSSMWIAVIRGSIAIVIGLGLFGRGLRAKHRVQEQKLLNDAMAKLEQVWPNEPRDQS